MLTITPQQRIERGLNACEAAAAAEGLTATRARQCEDGQHCCRACPWKATAPRWKASRSATSGGQSQSVKAGAAVARSEA